MYRDYGLMQSKKSNKGALTLFTFEVEYCKTISKHRLAGIMQYSENKQIGSVQTPGVGDKLTSHVISTICLVKWTLSEISNGSCKLQYGFVATCSGWKKCLCPA